MAGSSVRIVFNHLPGLGDALRTKVSAVVRKTAFDIEGHAKEQSHVLTGAMKASTYVSIAGEAGDYNAATGQARTSNPKAAIHAEEAPQGERGLSATVGVAVEYGIYEQSKAGHEALLPAAEAMREPFVAALKAIGLP